MSGHAARVPLHHSTASQGGENDTLTGRTGALHVNEHGQIVESEFSHDLGLFGM